MTTIPPPIGTLAEMRALLERCVAYATGAAARARQDAIHALATHQPDMDLAAQKRERRADADADLLDAWIARWPGGEP